MTCFWIWRGCILGHFLNILALIVEGAFHLCETAITLTFIWVYGRLAIHHILSLGHKDQLSEPPKKDFAGPPSDWEWPRR